MNASRVLFSMSPLCPQTSASRASRVTTRSRLLSNTSRIANSVFVRLMICPSTRTSRLAVLRERFAGAQDDGLAGRTTAGGGAHAGQKDVEREGLRHIVVRADIQALDDVCRSIARRQHQDRSLAAALSQSLRDLETVQTGQHEIEDDHVKVRVAAQSLKPFRHHRGKRVTWLPSSFNACARREAMRRSSSITSTCMARYCRTVEPLFPMPTHWYNTGITNRFSSVDVSSPPRITIAIGCSISCPGCLRPERSEAARGLSPDPSSGSAPAVPQRLGRADRGRASLLPRVRDGGSDSPA